MIDIEDPTKPRYIGDTDVPQNDPLVPGISPPEGNAHQAEFSVDNQYVLAADEDFNPYRADKFFARRLNVKPRNMLTQLAEWTRLGFLARTGAGTYALAVPP